MRENATPLVLWICAAVCVHYMFAEGGGVVARVHDDHMFLEVMGAQVREQVRLSEQSFDVIVDGPTNGAEPPPPPPDEQAKQEKKDEPKIEKPKPDAPKPPPEVKKAPPPIKVVVKQADPLKKLDEPLPAHDKRIAVRQHVKANQDDNPNAHFIADEANHVDEETAATQTNNEKDDPDPTPGGNHAGPQGQTGDSNRTKIAQDEDHPGEKMRAPGEKGTEFDIQKDPMPTRPMGPVAILEKASTVLPRAGGDGRTPNQVQNTPPPELAPGGPIAPSPEVQESPSGEWVFNPVKPGGAAGTSTQAGPGQASRVPQQAPPGQLKWLGLGGAPGAGQVNINLSHDGVVAAVGVDELRKERVADGERRKSEHRGSWTASNFEHWRSAIENYVSSVKPGNQTALNAARVPFASYIASIHNRIHPIFADGFLDSLDGLPPTHPLNDQHLMTRLEIVLTKDGRIVKMGVARSSGITAFDIAALDSVNRASPFGPAPGAIISPDGNVYLHWEFHRDEVYACSTQNAAPYILNVPAKTPTEDPVAPPPAPTSPSQERGTPPPANIHETREGALETRRDALGS